MHFHPYARLTREDRLSSVAGDPPACRPASPWSRIDRIGFRSYECDLRPVTTVLLGPCGLARVLLSLCTMLATPANSLALASRSRTPRRSPPCGGSILPRERLLLTIVSFRHFLASFRSAFQLSLSVLCSLSVLGY